MIRKICGMMLILGITFMWGWQRVGKEKRRCAELSAFLRLCECIGERIGTFRIPLDMIYRSFSDPVLFARGFLSLLGDAEGDESALFCALQHYAASGMSALNDGDFGLLLYFAEKLGTEDLSGTVKRCSYYAARLRERLKAAETELSSNGKLLRLLPPTVGGLLLILLL